MSEAIFKMQLNAAAFISAVRDVLDSEYEPDDINKIFQTAAPEKKLFNIEVKLNSTGDVFYTVNPSNFFKEYCKKMREANSDGFLIKAELIGDIPKFLNENSSFLDVCECKDASLGEKGAGVESASHPQPPPE